MIVWLIYLLTSILTELVRNHASVLVVKPIAINLAETLVVGAWPILVAAMVAAPISLRP